MYGENAEDVMYYLTVYNEPIVQPAEPEGVDAEGIVKGMYLLSKGSFESVGEDARRVQLLASGVAVPWAIEAQQLLKGDFGVVADVWSVTSWNNLRRDAMEAEEQAFPTPRTAGAPRTSPSAWPTLLVQSLRPPITRVRCPIRSPSGCRGIMPP
ncbi:pyruvate dehydrogenase E1 component [Cutibacterium acnes JCM 18909]|nr:pyruvate dehydrogenase E1 component [Cutibacterium acnes JCM 18909]